VRRMTAAVGFPALRLLRVRIGNFEPRDLPAGTWRVLEAAERTLALESGNSPTTSVSPRPGRTMRRK